MIGQYETQLEGNLPLCAIGDHKNPHRSVHAVAHDVERAANLLGTNPSSDKIESFPPPTVNIIQTQQESTFCRTAATQLGQRYCKFSVNKER